jgi:hypothetical protein
MNGSFVHMVDLFAFSAFVWGLIYLFTNFRLKKFIVSRYKVETNLTRTAFFRNHVPFVPYLPDYLSAGFFGTHLMMCIWGWQLFGKRKVFSDIDDPHVVIRHFSKNEIRRVKWVLMSGFILFAHGIAYFIFRSIWPEVFSR